MLKAKVRIETRGNVFEIGQSVSGLSKTDKEWALEHGYVEEAKDDSKKADEE